jgi:hypothetical protein
MGLHYVKTDRTVTHVMTTALAGLAFLANGSTPSAGTYRNNLALIVRYLRDSLPEILEASPRLAGGGGGPIYSAALCLQFFVHLHEKEKDDPSAKTARSLVAYLVDCVGEKVGVSVWKKGKDGGTVWFVSGVTALVNSSVLALARARAAGFDVPERIFTLAKDYYAAYWEANGSVKYDQHNMFPEEPRQGRSIAALMVLKALGADGDDRYKPAWTYARENLTRTMTHHTPSLHMSYGAHAFRCFGKEDWRKYVEAYFEKLIARQKENGSVEKIWDHDAKLFMTPNDTLWGAPYATAHLAIILQVATGHVQLVKAK